MKKNAQSFFQVPFLLGGAHTQTMVSSYWPKNSQWPSHCRQETVVRLEDDQVLVSSHFVSDRVLSRGNILLVHGFMGSSESAYMSRMALLGLKQGFDVHRMNLRGYGHDKYSTTGAHAGLWLDIVEVIDALSLKKPLYIVGVSLGGNTVLKMLGEWGEKASQRVDGVASLSSPLNLSITTQWVDKSIYGNYFLRALLNNHREKRNRAPHLYRGMLKHKPSSLWEFDNHVTAPLYGFEDAEDYYTQNSSGPLLEKIQVPTLMIYSIDDPIIPAENYQKYWDQIEENPHIQTIISEEGGHVGFIRKREDDPQKGRFWAEEKIVSFFSDLAKKKTFSNSNNKSP